MLEEVICNRTFDIYYKIVKVLDHYHTIFHSYVAITCGSK